MILPSGALLTPIGTITVTAQDDRLVRLTIGGHDPIMPTTAASPLVREALAQLAAWFAGTRTQFGLPLAPPRGPRGAALRVAIAAIPSGGTASYGMLARSAASSPRALGQACARNPFPIIIPCHRVTGGSGPGYYSAGDGIHTKRWLLAHEARVAQNA